MNQHLPALIVTDPRCVSSLLAQGIASSLLTHHLFAATAPASGAVNDAPGEARITGDDYW